MSPGSFPHVSPLPQFVPSPGAAGSPVVASVQPGSGVAGYQGLGPGAFWAVWFFSAMPSIVTPKVRKACNNIYIYIVISSKPDSSQGELRTRLKEKATRKKGRQLEEPGTQNERIMGPADVKVLLLDRILGPC